MCLAGSVAVSPISSAQEKALLAKTLLAKTLLAKTLLVKQVLAKTLLVKQVLAKTLLVKGILAKTLLVKGILAKTLLVTESRVVLTKVVLTKVVLTKVVVWGVVGGSASCSSRDPFTDDRVISCAGLAVGSATPASMSSRGSGRTGAPTSCGSVSASPG
jgi:hypothetical protein